MHKFKLIYLFIMISIIRGEDGDLISYSHQYTLSLMLIEILITTMITEIKKGVFVLSRAKKKFDNILTSAKAGIPYPKYFKASAVFFTSNEEKEPYPNKALTISSEAKIKPKLAGTDNNKESSKDFLWIFESCLMFLFLNAFERAGKETVPTAIPAIARLIW